MYEFHYKHIKRKYNAKLLFTDTDSLVYETESGDYYEDFEEDKNLFDFSNYTRDSKFFDLPNQKVIGKIKDEFKGKIISEFVELKPNIYSLINADGEESKKGRGVNKNVVNKEVMRHKIKRIENKLHEIGTYDVCKIPLSWFDDKKYILDDGINSSAYFL